MKFDFYNLEIRFHKRKVSFLVVKTVKCKRAIRSLTHEINFASYKSYSPLINRWKLNSSLFPICTRT